MSMAWPIRWIAAVALMTAHCVAFAQDFPTRPITLVAPFPAGSVTDSVSRGLGQALQEILGQPVWWTTAPARKAPSVQLTSRTANRMATPCWSRLR